MRKSWVTPHLHGLLSSGMPHKALDVCGAHYGVTECSPMTTATKSHQTINPRTGETLASYEFLSEEQAVRRVTEAHQGFLDWRTQDIEKRAQTVETMGRLLRSHKNELAQLAHEEMGKSLKEAGQEVELCAAICEYEANHGPGHLQDEECDLQGGRALISFQPLGIVLGIQPWNFPVYQVIRYAAPNLVAGNAVLLKHADNVWGMGQKLQRLFHRAGVPESVFQSLTIGHDVTKALIEHPLVRGVTFTGSASGGAKVAAAAAGAIKKTVLELGSNDAYLILADADLEKAAKQCAIGRLNNGGQTCVAAKRFLVEAPVYDDFRELFIQRMKSKELPPMARPDLRETLHRQVRESIDKGARCVMGGKIPEGRGFFYPATVLENVRAGMPAYDDELFGPVASLIKVESPEDGLRIANDSRFGLGGGIFSKDVKKAVEMARLYFDTGMVNINGYHLAQPHLPFGGVKDSGYGREHGGFGIREFVNVKTVMIAEG